MKTVLAAPERVLDIMHSVASAEILPRFQKLKDSDISEKKPGDLVTVADHASEAAFRKHLPQHLPGSVVVGEEGYEDDHTSLDLLNGNDPVWIVDPVDGTRNFAHGKQPFTVIVALVHEGVTHAGWIIDPLKQDAVWAVKGQGAWHMTQGGITKIDRITKTSDDLTMTAGSKLRERMAKASEETGRRVPNVVDRYRCAGREYMDIAIGTLDLARFGGILKPWDHAAGCLIIRELGGVAENIDTGLPYEVSTTLASQSIGIAAEKPHSEAFKVLLKKSDAYF